jgi:hypothetical protein
MNLHRVTDLLTFNRDAWDWGISQLVNLPQKFKGYLHFHGRRVEQVAESVHCGKPYWTKAAGSCSGGLLVFHRFQFG